MKPEVWTIPRLDEIPGYFLNLKRDGKCLWKHKGRECLDEEFGSGGGSIGGSNGGYSGGSNGGSSSGQNNGTGSSTGSGSSPDKDFYRDFQKMLTHTMDISIARSTINLYL